MWRRRHSSDTGKAWHEIHRGADGAGAGHDAGKVVRTDAESGFTTPLGHNYMAVAEFESEEMADLFQSEASPQEVEGVYADPEIAPFPTVCPGGAVGAVSDVENQINIAPVHAAGQRGQGVRIAVVDTGIDSTRINVSGALISQTSPHRNIPGGPWHVAPECKDARIEQRDA